MRIPPAPHDLLERHVGRIPDIRRDDGRSTGVVGRADADVVARCYVDDETLVRCRGKRRECHVAEHDVVEGGRVGGPVEADAADRVEGVAQVDGQDRRRVGEGRLPLRADGAVDGGEWELTRLEGGAGEHRRALQHVARDSGILADLAVRNDDGGVGREGIVRVAVAEGDGDGRGSVGAVGAGEGAREPRDGGVGLVGGGVDGMALPVEGAIAERWDLRRQAGVDVEAVDEDAKP